MRPAVPVAMSLALLSLIAGCAKPHPVRTEAEAVAVARQALGKIEKVDGPLKARRDGARWIVDGPRTNVGANWSQFIVDIDSRTGKATVSAFQYAEINEQL